MVQLCGRVGGGQGCRAQCPAWPSSWPSLPASSPAAHQKARVPCGVCDVLRGGQGTWASRGHAHPRGRSAQPPHVRLPMGLVSGTSPDPKVGQAKVCAWERLSCPGWCVTPPSVCSRPPRSWGLGWELTWTLAPSPHCSRGLLCRLPLHTFPLGPWGPAQVTCSVPSPALYFRGLGRGFDTGAAGRGSRAKWGHREGCTGQWSAWIRVGVLSLGLRGGLGSEAAAWQRGACWRVWAAAPWRAGGFQGAPQG